MKRLLSAALLTLSLAAALPAAAQSPATFPARGGTADEAARLAATLKDDKARARLIAELEALAAARGRATPEAESGVLADLSKAVGEVGDTVMEGLTTLADAPRLIRRAADALADPAGRALGSRLLLHLVAILAAGLTAERLAGLALLRIRRSMLPKPGARLAARLPLALAHMATDLVPVAAFAAATLGSIAGFRLAGGHRAAALLAVAAWGALRLTLAAADLLVAPRRPALRLLPVDDETAEYLAIWTRRFVGTGLSGWLFAEAALMFGLPRPAYLLVVKILGLTVAAMAELFVFQNRQAGAALIRRLAAAGGNRLRAAADRLARVWHGLAATYVAAFYLTWALPVRGGADFLLRATALTAVILGAAAAASNLIDHVVDRAFAVSQEARDRFPGLEARANRYLPALRLFFRGVVAAATPLALLQAWGIGSFAWIGSDLGRQVLSSGISIAAVLAGAAAVWEVVAGAIERCLAADGAHAAPRSARLRTLLPLARSALLVVLVTTVAMIVLAELGVNIAPLLAGAGVVGIAIGFGSQKLVQDVITGAFILFEDTMAVGDVVKLDAHSGVVESLSIRAIRLRDGQGAIHTVPFSTVGTVVNMSRDFGCAVFDIGVAYHEDVDRVGETLRDLGDEMRADPLWRDRLLEPLTVLGLERLDASGMVVRASVRTPPLQQSDVQREFLRRVRRRFSELGIDVPVPQTKVWVANRA